MLFVHVANELTSVRVFRSLSRNQVRRHSPFKLNCALCSPFVPNLQDVVAVATLWATLTDIDGASLAGKLILVSGCSGELTVTLKVVRYFQFASTKTSIRWSATDSLTLLLKKCSKLTILSTSGNFFYS